MADEGSALEEMFFQLDGSYGAEEERLRTRGDLPPNPHAFRLSIDGRRGVFSQFEGSYGREEERLRTRGDLPPPRLWLYCHCHQTHKAGDESRRARPLVKNEPLFHEAGFLAEGIAAFFLSRCPV